MVIFWVNFAGTLEDRMPLDGGERRRQGSFVGHSWIAFVNGEAVSSYVSSLEETEWLIEFETAGTDENP